MPDDGLLLGATRRIAQAVERGLAKLGVLDDVDHGDTGGN